MSLADLKKLAGGLGVHAQSYNGRWFLVGTVPVEATYERKDGQPLTQADIDAARHVGPGIAGLRVRTYATKAEALAAAGIKEGA